MICKREEYLERLVCEFIAPNKQRKTTWSFLKLNIYLFMSTIDPSFFRHSFFYLFFDGFDIKSRSTTPQTFFQWMILFNFPENQVELCVRDSTVI